MPRRDEIDATLARHFAWTFVPSDRPEMASAKVEAALGAAKESPGAPTEPVFADPEEEERRARAAAIACRPLAEAVTTAWACTEEDSRLRLVKRLLPRAERLGFTVLGMIEWPLEAVRLLRLCVQIAPHLSRKQRERVASLARLIPLDHAETADLLVEVARAGDAALADAIFSEDDWVPEVGDEAALVARLADVVDEGPTHASRAVAVEIITQFDRREPAVPALRRALRLQSFAVRARALDALATAEPCAVAADDLVHVLRDLVAHAPPEALVDEAREDDERLFAGAVLAALAHVQPDDAAEALLDWIDAENDSLWLDAGWATEALAIGFAETGAVMVDHWLKCASVPARYRAIAAIERLPAEMAEPRLRIAAGDPATLVRDSARQQWLTRFGQTFRGGADSLFAGSLLEGPPSERFAARLGVIEGRVEEARRAMTRVLFAEAPDTEALVLLVQVLADEPEGREPQFSTQASGWPVTLVERFGAKGVEALALLAKRFPEPESFGWMRRLADLVERGVIAREHTAPLRELASKHVVADDAGQIDDALRLLTLVGAPPELLDRVMALALTDELGAWEARKLLAAWPDRTIDARLVSNMAMALADRDWARLENASWMALERDVSAARVVAQRVLELAEETDEAIGAASACARNLRERGVLTDAWAIAALGRPESPACVVAARVWRGSAAVRAALEALRPSSGRAGASAAEAAMSLVNNAEPLLSPRDRRLQSVLAAAPPPERAELLVGMCVHGAPYGSVAPYLEALFTSTDERVTSMLVGLTGWLKSPKAQAMFRQVLPRVVDAELRADIEEHLGHVPEPYWAEG